MGLRVSHQELDGMYMHILPTSDFTFCVALGRVYEIGDIRARDKSSNTFHIQYCCTVVLTSYDNLLLVVFLHVTSLLALMRSHREYLQITAILSFSSFSSSFYLASSFS